ncbi:phage portal protein [Agrilactobacillus fermenti]|uniref:phage portal protein n=1 Tax=Agrilactobacillus fermenti TaxID=2586909 RepID=UPI001E4DD1ED|nr:phage portal protein [Agrilactobacillus fermenti]
MNGVGSITDNGLFIYPADTEITKEDLQNFIKYHQSNLVPDYQKKFDLYKGNHEMLTIDTHRNGRIDNRIVANLPHYVVDTFNGYFVGIPPKITLEENAQNEGLQTWLNINSFVDVLSEVSKQADIFGQSFIFGYQDEDSNTQIAYSDPMHSFMIYDDTIQRRPLAFVRYGFNEDNELSGTIYLADRSYTISADYNMVDQQPNVFEAVPAVEFFENEERQGVLDNIVSLANALDKALSQKANQNEYFDNAYLLLAGLQLPTDDKGNPVFQLIENQMIYAPDADAANAKAEFLTKPDGDNMQEHLIDRLTDLIYQISMVPNLNDEAFSGNSSGVALQFKLLPMKNKAQNKERKFTQSLRNLFKVLFTPGKIVGSGQEAWQDLQFKFTRNMPVNVADEAQTASTLEGIVSKETQLSVLSIVDDPKAEMDKMAQEQKEKLDQAVQNSASALDFQKSSGQQDNEDQEAAQKESDK